MRIVGLALAGVLAITTPISGHAAGPGTNLRSTNSGPASNIVLVWDGGGSGEHSGAIGGRPGAARTRQWNGGSVSPHWGPNRYYGGCCFYGGPSVPTYWV